MSTYSGSFPKIQIQLTRADIVKNMEAWAKKIAADNRYYYKTWSAKESRTHLCPVCNPKIVNQSYLSYPAGQDGWNCIGLAFAIWRHGGGLKNKCSCGTISNAQGERIYNASSDAAALKLAQEYIGITNIEVIRNNKKTIPKSQAKPGDIGLLFDGNTYKHTFFIMSGNKIADSTGSGSKANHIRADRTFSGRYVSGLKVIIRFKTADYLVRNYLKINDKGEEVKKLQLFLNWALNKKLAADGIFGSNTEAAVKEFQKMQKLTIDGLFGSECLKAAKRMDKKTSTPSTPSTKPYQNLNAKNYISDTVRIGQATSDERGKTSGGSAGDQTKGEVSMTNWSYAAGNKYNTWKYVFRAKDTTARLKIAQAAIDACNNNHIGYDTGASDRKSCFKAAQKVNFDLSKITTNCETTCSELANVCIAAAGLKSYLPVTKNAYVGTLKDTLVNSSEFRSYTDASYVARKTKLIPGDILISGTHVAIVVKAPAKKTTEQIAKEVIEGKWGSGEERKKKLTNAGYNYTTIQNKVNELLSAKSTPTTSTKKAYTGVLPTTKLVKTNAEVIQDTIKWALWIAGDNRFHYGYTSKDKKVNAHHNGCYFCGTNKSQKKGMLDPEFTYCCNPFVGAAWAHGGCIPKALDLCQHTKSWSFSKGGGYDASSLFTNLGHPAKSSLKPGDVLCKDTHVALYIGNGKIVQAGAGDDNKRNSVRWNKSISVITLTDTNYKNFKRVHRFNSSVNTTMNIYHGEVSKRVSQWQAFLDWYFDGKVGKADGYFGDNTLKWTKKFQEEVIGKGQGDGIIGPKTLEAAKKVKK